MFFTINNKQIWFTEKGKGQPVILVHGYLETAEVWGSFGDRLSDRFRVLAIDLPGHGKSESFGETHTMELMADIIRGMMDWLQIKKAVVAGHSMGGYATLAFLKKYPEYLAGYCLFHSHPLPDMSQTVEKRKKDIATVLEGKKDLLIPDSIGKMFASMNLGRMNDKVQRSIRIAGTVEGNAVIAVLNGMIQRSSGVKIMEEGRVPCLWILGKYDNYIPFDAMPQRVDMPGNARLVILDNSGHMGFVEEEERSVVLFFEFLKSLDQF